MAAEIGTAYVKIEPTAKGISGKIEKELGGVGASSGNAFTKGFGSVIGGVTKVAMGAVAAGATAVGGLVTSAVNSYGEYEQLVGGIETLFGDSAQTVIDNADRAFQSAGMSANDYMETSIQSAAALINSLGGDTTKAADLMDMSITDMADNVNKMGTNMEAVQNAYRGFSRGNFTMLDNLALGFAGTKEGMQELLDQAQKISGVKYDISSYSDIVEAIHVVQQEMGITGTTSKEAASTIQGSLSSVKAAWENTLTAIANGDGWDIGAYIENLVDVVKTFAGNIMPVVQQALVGVSLLIESLAPEIAAAIPDLISQVLPGLLSAGVSIIETLSQGILQAIPGLLPCVMDVVNSLLDMVLQLAPDLLSAGLDIILQLANGITSAIPTIIPALTSVTVEILTMLTDPQMLTSLIQTGVDLILALIDGILQALPELTAAAPTIIQNLVSALTDALPALIDGCVQIVALLTQNIPQIIQGLIQASPQIIEALVVGLVQAAPGLIAAGPMMMGQLIIGLVQNLPQAFSFGKQLIDSIIEGLSSAKTRLTAEGPKVLTELYNRMSPEMKKFLQSGRELVQQIIQGVKGIANNLYNAGADLIKNLKAKITSTIKDFAQIGQNIVKGIKEGLEKAWEDVVKWFTDKINDLKKKVKDVLKIESPSKVFADEVGRMIPLGIAEGIEEGMGTLDNTVIGMAAGLPSTASDAMSASTYQADTSNSALYDLLVQYLPIIAQGENVNVILEADAGRMFRIMQAEQRKYTQLVGV